MVFTEVPAPANVPRTAAVPEIVAPSGHLVRVPASIVTRCSGCSRSCRQHVDAARVGTSFRRQRRDRPAPVARRPSGTSAGGAAPGPVVRPRVRVLQPPTQSGEVAGCGNRTGSGCCTSGWRPGPSRCWTATRSTPGSRTCYWQDSRSYVSAAATFDYPLMYNEILSSSSYSTYTSGIGEGGVERSGGKRQ